MQVDEHAQLKKLMSGEVVEIVCERVRDASKVLRNQSFAKEVQIFGDRLNVVVENARRDFYQVELKLRQNGIGINSWRVISQSLENVFISLLTHNEKNEVVA